MNGAGVKCIKQLLETIKAQKYDNYEVIISDHSDNDEIENTVKQFNKSNFYHFYNSENKGSSSGNINNAIKLANSDFIKVMFQDDFFVNQNSLKIVNDCFNKSNWGVSSCIHYKSKEKYFYNTHYPQWQDGIKRGINTLGGPSVVFFKRCDVNFDTNLLWFMDIDFYYRLYKLFGKPYIENKILVGIREDSYRVSNTLINDDLIKRESEIIRSKYD